jgi:exodeoxyribonuclease VII small subunit
MNTATQATEKNIEMLSFEEALKELEHIVGNLESGKAPLEDSISLYERGDSLRKHCEKKLADAQTKIEKISVNKDGSLSTAPLDEQE